MFDKIFLPICIAWLGATIFTHFINRYRLASSVEGDEQTLCDWEFEDARWESFVTAAARRSDARRLLGALYSLIVSIPVGMSFCFHGEYRMGAYVISAGVLFFLSSAIVGHLVVRRWRRALLDGPRRLIISLAGARLGSLYYCWSTPGAKIRAIDFNRPDPAARLESVEVTYGFSSSSTLRVAFPIPESRSEKAEEIFRRIAVSQNLHELEDGWSRYRPFSSVVDAIQKKA